MVIEIKTVVTEGRDKGWLGGGTGETSRVLEVYYLDLGGGYTGIHISQKNPTAAYLILGLLVYVCNTSAEKKIIKNWAESRIMMLGRIHS